MSHKRKRNNIFGEYSISTGGTDIDLDDITCNTIKVSQSSNFQGSTVVSGQLGVPAQLNVSGLASFSNNITVTGSQFSSTNSTSFSVVAPSIFFGGDTVVNGDIQANSIESGGSITASETILSEKNFKLEEIDTTQRDMINGKGHMIYNSDTNTFQFKQGSGMGSWISLEEVISDWIPNSVNLAAYVTDKSIGVGGRWGNVNAPVDATGHFASLTDTNIRLESTLAYYNNLEFKNGDGTLYRIQSGTNLSDNLRMYKSGSLASYIDHHLEDDTVSLSLVSENVNKKPRIYLTTPTESGSIWAATHGIEVGIDNGTDFVRISSDPSAASTIKAFSVNNESCLILNSVNSVADVIMTGNGDSSLQIINTNNGSPLQARLAVTSASGSLAISDNVNADKIFLDVNGLTQTELKLEQSIANGGCSFTMETDAATWQLASISSSTLQLTHFDTGTDFLMYQYLGSLSSRTIYLGNSNTSDVGTLVINEFDKGLGLALPVNNVDASTNFLSGTRPGTIMWNDTDQTIDVYTTGGTVKKITPV